MKRKINLTESQLRNIVHNSVKRILKEDYSSELEDYYTSEINDDEMSEYPYSEYPYDELYANGQDTPINILSAFEEKTKIKTANDFAYSIVNKHGGYLREIIYHVAKEIRKHPKVKEKLIQGLIEYMNNLKYVANNIINQAQKL